MEKTIINGEGAVFGRLCSYAAKRALEGEEIIILNSEKTILTGNRKDILNRFLRLKKLGGTSNRGPNYPRIPHMILKRGIRGMLPNHREGIGRQAFLRIKCYEGIPKEFEGKKMIKIEKKDKEKYVELGDIAKNF